MFLKSLVVLALTAIVSVTAHSQTPAEVRINPQQPTIYFTADRLVKEKLWLRLHNNSRWAIRLWNEQPNEITIPLRLPDGHEVKSLIDGAEISPKYVIENPVAGFYQVHSCPTFEAWIAPGNSVLMPVDVERLKPLADFSVRFSYEWEGEGPEPDHRVRFRYYPETKVPPG